jgi:hypothetical protein
MACSRCHALYAVYPVKRPAHLRVILQLIRAHLADHTIVPDFYGMDKDDLRMQPDLAELSAEGPWPDYFEYRFRCPCCSQIFRLAVETYHGSGGRWEPHDADSM